MFDAAPFRSTMSARRRRPTNLRSAAFDEHADATSSTSNVGLWVNIRHYMTAKTMTARSMYMVILDYFKGCSNMVKRYTLRASASSVFTHTYQISYACVKYHRRSFLHCL